MTVIPMEKDLELGMDGDGPDLESGSAMDSLSLAALVDDGIEPTFEALNTWMLDQCLRSVDYPVYADWAGASRRSTGARNRRRGVRGGRLR
ncbi:hypothetical protein JKG47_17800 [Acidithiobacillus sp. MC6.1]|nr:hypothetical protein [Acidithiobacillus sp. MC6.1]